MLGLKLGCFSAADGGESQLPCEQRLVGSVCAESLGHEAVGFRTEFVDELVPAARLRVQLHVVQELIRRRVHRLAHWLRVHGCVGRAASGTVRRAERGRYEAALVERGADLTYISS